MFGLESVMRDVVCVCVCVFMYILFPNTHTYIIKWHISQLIFSIPTFKAQLRWNIRQLNFNLSNSRHKLMNKVDIRQDKTIRLITGTNTRYEKHWISNTKGCVYSKFWFDLILIAFIWYNYSNSNVSNDAQLNKKVFLSPYENLMTVSEISQIQIIIKEKITWDYLILVIEKLFAFKLTWSKIHRIIMQDYHRWLIRNVILHFHSESYSSSNVFLFFYHCISCWLRVHMLVKLLVITNRSRQRIL